MILEGDLLEKLRKIEALHAGTTVSGEREAAGRAAERIRARLEELRAKGAKEEVELLYSLQDPWQRRLFVALCRRYGLRPFREWGRRASTIQVRAPKEFHEKTPLVPSQTLDVVLAHGAIPCEARATCGGPGGLARVRAWPAEARLRGGEALGST